MLNKETSAMTTHLTAGQRALLQAELESRQRQLSRQLEVHQEGRSRVEHARDVLAQDFDLSLIHIPEPTRPY